MLAQLQAANGKAEDSKKTFDLALNHPTAGPLDIHKAEALKYAREAMAQAPNEASRNSLQALIQQIEAGTAN